MLQVLSMRMALSLRTTLPLQVPPQTLPRPTSHVQEPELASGFASGSEQHPLR